MITVLISGNVLLRYLPPVSHPLQHITRDAPLMGFAAHPSSDASLSAFAQLGAIRLGAQRVLISLFGRHEEHIIAEATQTLSLRDENNHQPHDELLFGMCTMSYGRSLALAITNSPQTPTQPTLNPPLIIPDLTKDDAYQHHPDVIDFPHFRFLASAPIISPGGIVVGTYTVLDDKPRELVAPDLADFLSDMATIVMKHLDSLRTRTRHLRAERMIIGLGSFLEGKGCLRNLWLDQVEATVSPGHDNIGEGSANMKQQDKQRLDDKAEAMRAKSNSSRDMTLRLAKDQGHGVPPSERQRSPLFSRSTKKSVIEQTQTPYGPSGINGHAEGQGSKPRSNKEAFTTQIQETFSRAANIIRESLEIEAAVFFDCKFDGQGTSVPNSMSDTESGLESSSADEEINATKPGARSELPTSAVEASGKTTVNPGNILGFATSNVASVNGESKGDPNIALSQSFLAGLLRRYPKGKIFNFGEDGSLSSNDSSESAFNSQPAKRYKKTRKSVLRQDASTLLDLAPNSRSIIFSPIWDTHKSRWYAGTLAWTRSPQRIFTNDDELTFCMVFGNCLMAEVHRLGALFTDQATTDLLAGLSHELRSPLHGISGTAEMLNDTALNALQRGFLHTIVSCASTLLGSINQLLEFSSVNDLQGLRGTKSLPSHRQSHSGKPVTQGSEANAASIVPLDAVIEETIETVFAGFSFLYNSHSHLIGLNVIGQGQQNSITSSDGVKLILDIDNSPTWSFVTRPGAWNVILTNVVGNALKYTKQGYIYVSAKVKPVHSKDSETRRSTVTISVQDTGCGMNAEFLRDGYFTAFSQENDNTPGNGLGANITKRTISSLGGEFKVHSQTGIGTEVTLSATLDHSPDHLYPAQGLANDLLGPHILSARKLLSQKSIGLLGLEGSQFSGALFSSLQKICEDRLQMRVCLVAPSSAPLPYCDFYIATHESLDMGNLGSRRLNFDPNIALAPPVIVMCSSSNLARSLFVLARQRGDLDVLEFISQPCGPKKLAKSLETCLKRQARRAVRVATPGGELPIPSPHQGLNNQASPPARNKVNAPLKTQSMDGIAAIQAHSKPAEHVDVPPVDSSSSTSAPTIPLTPDSNPTPTEKINPHPHTQTEGESTIVLLVDDNDINMSLLVAFMKKLRLDYLTVRNGQEALDRFKKHPHQIRVVLMGILWNHFATEYPVQSTKISFRYLNANHGRIGIHPADSCFRKYTTPTLPDNDCRPDRRRPNRCRARCNGIRDGLILD